MKKIALITSGGDAPGMNACIRAVVKTCLHYKIIPFGIFDGFQGIMIDRRDQMNYTDVDNIIQRGGTILGTARCQEFMQLEGRLKAIDFLKSENIDGLIVIGGDGSFTGAYHLGLEMNIPIIGIPGTIDNDIAGTDYTIGFDTALNTVMEAVDKIRDTATSHHRIFFVEVMGRDAGFIALHSAISSGAESVLIPEKHMDIEKLVRDIQVHNKGRRSSIIIVAEGDEWGGAMELMEKVKPLLPSYDFRCSVLGHIQRGGSPSAMDRIIATRMGSYAVELLMEKQTNLMIGIKGDNLVTCSVEHGIKENAIPNLTKIKLLAKLRTK